MYKELLTKAIEAWNDSAPTEYQLKYVFQTFSNTNPSPSYHNHLVKAQIYGFHGAIYYQAGDFIDTTIAEEHLCKTMFIDLIRSGIGSQYKILLDSLDNNK